MSLIALKQKLIFVFGSNLAGRHGAGAARDAYEQFGAVYGVGYGLTGRSFAIPTKDRGNERKDLATLCNASIVPFIVGFIAFAQGRPDLEFQLTRIGCGLAGKTDAEMASLLSTAAAEFFDGLPKNIWLPEEWLPVFPSWAKKTIFSEKTKTVSFWELKGFLWTEIQ